MTGAIYLLSRKVNGDSGETFMQNVTVFASNANDARDLVTREFERIRRITGETGGPYGTTPDWNVQKVALDAEKLITAGITT